jgi:methyl-accepting chemotaxis protein
MIALAMWFQDAAPVGFSNDSEKMIAWSLVVIAIALALQALLYIGIGIGALAAIKKVKGTVDEVRHDLKGTIADVRRELKAEADEIKGKLYPVIESVTHISKTTQSVLTDAEPKIKIVTDHLVETSRVVRVSAEKLSQTVGDANQKTQRQVARVDGMVTAALDTTAEVVHTIEHGIKVPAQKVAQAATQARFVAEGLMDKIKAIAGGLPFLQSRRPAPSAATRSYPPPRPRNATTPAAATGSVPLIK